MSLNKNLPIVQNFSRPKDYHWDMPADVFSDWSQRVLALDEDDATIISIYEVIGEDWWTGEGWTPKRMERALSRAGGKDITVRLNTPGGDMFDGIAIYSLLRAYDAKVTIQVMGYAASAGSIIAMAGDEIVMGLGTFMMVHNAWGVVIGNRNDFRDAADLFEQFDSAIMDIYEARASVDRKMIESLMSKETFMAPTEAVANGFADRLDEDLKAEDAPSNETNRGILARRETEAALAAKGYPRKDRADMISAMIKPVAPRDASHTTAARDAGIHVLGDVREFIESMNK